MFGKKKKKDNTGEEAGKDSKEASGKASDRKKKKKGSAKGQSPDTVETDVVEKKKSGWKKFFNKKAILFIFLSHVAVSIAGFVVYKIYFQDGTIEDIYVEKEMPNVDLPPEILKFSYVFLRVFYDSLVLFDNEVTLMEKEIERIADLGEQYPDQKNIADKEIRVWEKEKESLIKSYERLIKNLEAIFVSYRVNMDNGLELIEDQREDMVLRARDALTASMALTERLKLIPVENVPGGFVKGNIYKIKKKFQNFMN
ncbi:MAG: hypothetical protein HQK66_10985 [Desulfamplus sp.]|nr:hypothetical protein [Desulfamplus sp.]